ncbi:MAG: redoxin family protein [Phycisphaerales bacterium]|nr:redoxin family protein [Phycisphaerales bacterium]
MAMLHVRTVAAVVMLAGLGSAVTGAAEPGSGPAAPVVEAPAKASEAGAGPRAGAELIGKPPPALTVAKWVKGEPVTAFAPGVVYVVDLWATWCGPCRAAIPHLTTLQAKHPEKLRVIGVSISERQKEPGDTSYIQTVEGFVAKMGEKMNYAVAVDTPEKAVHTAWFKPAGTGGIPTAWIIDQRGLVAWVGIGTPSEVERIAEAVLAGTFDPAAEAKRAAELEATAAERAAEARERAKAREQETDRRFPGYRDAMAKGDTAGALAALDAAFAADPSLEAGAAYQWKIMLLLQRNKPDEIKAYAKELLARYPENGDVQGFLSACLVSTAEESRFDAEINALALRAAEVSLATANADSRWQQVALWRMGWAKYHAGRLTEAAEHIRQARANITRLKGTIDFGNLDSDCAEAEAVIAGAIGASGEGK